MQPSTEAMQKTSSLGFIQNMKLKIIGACKVGYRKEKGWKGELPLYAFKCDKHGIVFSTPQGHYNRLICPECLKNIEYNMMQELDLIHMTNDMDLLELNENQ